MTGLVLYVLRIILNNIFNLWKFLQKTQTIVLTTEKKTYNSQVKRASVNKLIDQREKMYNIYIYNSQVEIVFINRAVDPSKKDLKHSSQECKHNGRPEKREFQQSC